LSQPGQKVLIVNRSECLRVTQAGFPLAYDVFTVNTFEAGLIN